MRSASIVALFTAGRCDASGAVEFLRIVAALLACGRKVHLIETGPGRGALSADDVSDEAERYLRALADFNVIPTPLEGRELAIALADASSVLRYGGRDRSGEPPLLALGTDAGGDAPSVEQLSDAGQIVKIAQRVGPV